MEGAIYIGTEQFITLAAVLTVLGTALVFLAKHQFNQITGGISSNGKKMEQMKEELHCEIKNNNDKVNERIDHLEEKTMQDITALRQSVNDIKGDFSTIFVQRDEFYRYMNNMESSIKDTNSKVDRILMIVTERRGSNE